MQKNHHRLASASIGRYHELTSYHFGAPAAGAWPRKVYIQSSLHADEIPGMLVAHHLREALARLEAEGKLRGEVVLVPMANPIGLAQRVLHNSVGRFELDSGENFNRYYAEPSAQVVAAVGERLTDDIDHNRSLIRQALREALQAQSVDSELASLRQQLHLLAVDADLVIDLHCEWRGAIHIYANNEQWPRVEALAAYLHCPVSLLADSYGGMPFDEAIFMPWLHIRDALPGKPVPVDSVSVTVELRGQQDVNHELARQDANAILDFLRYQGLLAEDAPPVPPLPYPATPLEGSETLTAPHAGVVVLHAAMGEWIEPGQLVAEVVDTVDGRASEVRAGTAGVLYAGIHHPYTHLGGTVAKIAGAVKLQKSRLLDA